MRKIWIAAATFLTVGISSCSKEEGCTNVNPSTEQSSMQTYMSSNGITGTLHPSGMYYEITAPGGVAKPNLNSRVFVRYVGKTFDGKIFDQQNAAANTGFQLFNLIRGWQIGIPLVGKGGFIKLVIPSSLAYGCTGAGDDIPANTPLYFEIELVDFQ